MDDQQTFPRSFGGFLKTARRVDASIHQIEKKEQKRQGTQKRLIPDEVQSSQKCLPE